MTADALWDALRDVACTTGRKANCIVMLRKHDVEKALAALEPKLDPANPPLSATVKASDFRAAMAGAKANSGKFHEAARRHVAQLRREASVLTERTQPPMSDQPMPEPGFTQAETEAFDRGVKDGEQLRHNPYDFDTQFALWDAWENGASVGRLNRTGRI